MLPTFFVTFVRLSSYDKVWFALNIFGIHENCSGREWILLLSEILKDWPCTVSGSVGVSISGITGMSCKVKKGFVFVARKGARYDGSLLVQEAIERGAVAIVIDRTEDLTFDLNRNLPSSLFRIVDCSWLTQVLCCW